MDKGAAGEQASGRVVRGLRDADVVLFMSEVPHEAPGTAYKAQARGMTPWWDWFTYVQPEPTVAVWEPSLLESQIADLLVDAAPGYGLFLVPFKDLKRVDPFLGIVRTQNGEVRQ